MAGEPIDGADVVAVDFPRLHARTQGFTLGVPRSLTVTDDRVLFLRSPGDAPRQSLWCADGDGERLLADPDELRPDTGAEEGIPPEERARRERARERGSGIVAYATDKVADHAVFALGGKLMVCDVASGQTVQLAVDGPVFDPRPDPTGSRIAYVEDDALWVVRLDGTNAPRRIAHAPHPDVSWGLAEFVAAEEMGRTRGHWWAPDGTALLAARVDNAAVRQWWIAAPVDPDQRPTAIRYPAAGTPNAEVTLALVGVDGTQTPVTWDRTSLPYLAEVVWSEGHPPVLVVQSRDQTRLVHLLVDPGSGETTRLCEEQRQPWIELIPGSPTWAPDGRLARVVGHRETRKVALGPADGHTELRGHPDLMVASLVGVQGDDVLVTGHLRARPWCTVVAALHADATISIRSDPDGVASATLGGDRRPRLAISQQTADTTGGQVSVDGRVIDSFAHHPPELPARIHPPCGTTDQPVSLVLHPDWWTPEHPALPVLVDSYGGPHARRVLAAGGSRQIPAWFAANGFAVLVTDGPGAPGHSLAWEARIWGDTATPVLDGQIEALHRAAADHHGLLDLDRVAIRGWSYGGYLAALAVLRRPEVFHAAVAGAPVTDWTLYDTHYTERYLGHPEGSRHTYSRSSLIDDAARLRRPLLLIHGLADDNVVAAHTLRLSRALLEAGRSHEVLPLSGVTHFTPSEEVNTNLLLLQLRFVRRALGLVDAG